MNQSTLQVIQLADTWNTAGLTYQHLHSYTIHPSYILAKMRQNDFKEARGRISHIHECQFGFHCLLLTA